MFNIFVKFCVKKFGNSLHSVVCVSCCGCCSCVLLCGHLLTRQFLISNILNSVHKVREHCILVNH